MAVCQPLVWAQRYLAAKVRLREELVTLDQLVQDQDQVDLEHRDKEIMEEQEHQVLLDQVEVVALEQLDQLVLQTQEVLEV